MIPLEEAQLYVLDACTRADATHVLIRDALGCVTSGPVVATEAVPSFDNTAMDGYAVRAADTESAPSTLTVVDELRAGQAPSTVVGVGEAIQIMTGAPMPEGADAIVNVEETTRDGDAVSVAISVTPGMFVRRTGSDVAIGDVVVESDTELRAAHLGVLASVGEQKVSIYPRLKVGVLSTGDELVTDGSPLLPGQIRESNKEMLLGLVGQSNCEAVDLGVVADNEKSLRDAIEHGISTCDALITSGGVSMGEYDLVKVVLEQLGEMRWMQIAIQPAKPFAFGRISHGTRTIPIFGLPGNPVSSFVSFELLARPALRKMMGHRSPARSFVRAISDDGLKRRAGDGKTQWQRVHGSFKEDGRLHVSTTGEQGSHQLANSASANALACVPDSVGIAPGGDVDVLFLT